MKNETFNRSKYNNNKNNNKLNHYGRLLYLFYSKFFGVYLLFNDCFYYKQGDFVKGHNAL